MYKRQEFGHAVFNEKRKEISAILSNVTSGLFPNLHSDLAAKDSGTANRRLQKIVPTIVGIGKELFCDLVGCYLMGPAFFFSLYEIAWGQRRDYFAVSLAPNVKSIKAYPSMNFRLDKIKEYLKLDSLREDGKKLLGDKEPQLEGLLDLIVTIPTCLLYTSPSPRD